jgi:DNA-directed RNA polymerase subunit F
MLEDPVEDYFKKLEELKMDIEGMSESVVPLSGAKKILEDILTGQVQKLIQELNQVMTGYAEEIDKISDIINENE